MVLGLCSKYYTTQPLCTLKRLSSGFFEVVRFEGFTELTDLGLCIGLDRLVTLPSRLFSFLKDKVPCWQ